MNKINLMFLSVGRRVELIKCFKQARDELNIEGDVVGVDALSTAPALYFCDKRDIIPQVSSENYLDALIDLINKYDIAVVIPTIDTELMTLAKHKAFIEANTKAKVLISSEESIEICRNKNNTIEFFDKHGFGYPKQINDFSNVKFPLFIKPKDGSSSVNTFKINNLQELDFFKSYVHEPIIQEFISGTEYTVDCFADFEGNIISIVPRQRLSVRAGEILKGRIDKNPVIIADVRRMLTEGKFIGQVTIQLILSDSGIKYIEINPRFGGGAPMSIKAGANSCKNIYKLLLGEKLKYNEDYRDGLLFARFDDSVIIGGQ